MAGTESGMVRGEDAKEPAVGGMGEREVAGLGKTSDSEVCAECYGRGEIWAMSFSGSFVKKTCGRCEGSGLMEVAE